MQNHPPADGPSADQAVTLEKMNAVAIKLLDAIADQWEIDDHQRCVIAGIDTSDTLQHWRNALKNGKAPEIPEETLTRVSCMVGIHKALQSLFDSAGRISAWLRKPNRDLNGQSALDRMLSGEPDNLASIRRYLDSVSETNYF